LAARAAYAIHHPRHRRRPPDRRVAIELLALGGQLVRAAPDGAAGLQLARSMTPDLILLDYSMPGMDGLAVLKSLKADAATRRIPVVALTSGTAEHANALSRAGCRGFIPKPFAPVEFVRLVEQFENATVGRRHRGR
jgi:CheY-like chemotaxis protein